MNENPGMIKVLIVDDQRLVREGIASILKLYDDIDVCSVAADGEEAVRAARKYYPAVVLMDIQMPVKDGISATAEILADRTAKAVIMLTTFDDEEFIVKALRTGAAGYLMKDLPPDELHQAIQVANNGGFQSTTGIMGKLQQVIATRYDTVFQDRSDHDKIIQKLTSRERDVLRCIGQGLTNYEISMELGLSKGTVKNYVSNILDSMGFRDRIQAALFANKYFPDSENTT
ncbi:MAG: response regulator transcription factor [Spirochaetales bacterium]|nr:response regulator transcription factor [Spirochaetales bacterium]